MNLLKIAAAASAILSGAATGAAHIPAEGAIAPHEAPAAATAAEALDAGTSTSASPEAARGDGMFPVAETGHGQKI